VPATRSVGGYHRRYEWFDHGLTVCAKHLVCAAIIRDVLRAEARSRCARPRLRRRTER
jgi:hypothetical protein